MAAKKKTKRLRNFLHRELVEAGCDEAGRGCLAGPVVAAAVILPEVFRHPLLNDSKQVLPENRQKLAQYIRNKALAWGVGVVENTDIDRINILNASFQAMHLALNQLPLRPEMLLIDGNRFHPYQDLEHTCIVDGDAKFKAIAAASILAKVYRDELMEQLGEEFPQYGWEQNKGYGTTFHRQAIHHFGITPYHRKTFAPCQQEQLKLSFAAPVAR